MSEIPEALRLAQELDVASLGIKGCLEALSADAMLRQHAEIERLTADNEALRRDAEKWRSFAAAATELRRLYTEIERLKAANRELGDVVMDYKAGAQALSAENAILHAELEALRREAERYRWLQERLWFQHQWEVYDGSVQDLAAAIDAAMEDKT